MTHIVSGHGARVDSTETFVPEGTTVRFYSEVDYNLGTAVALIAIVDGVSAPPQERVEGGKSVYNYELSSEDAEFVDSLKAMAPPAGIPILHVGTDIPDKTRLCSAPDECQGTHECDGVLGLLGQLDEKDIVILACRGKAKSKRIKREEHYGTDRSHPLYDISRNIDAFVEEFMKVAYTDLAKAEEMADSLSQKDLALLNTTANFRTWRKARSLKEMAERKDYAGLAQFFQTNLDDLKDMMDWAWGIRVYRDAISAALEDDNCVAALSGLPSKTQDRIEKELNRTGAKEDWEPTESELAKIATRNAAALQKLKDGQSALIALAGDIVLIGEDHRDVIINYVQVYPGSEIGRFHLVKGGPFSKTSSKGSINVTGISDDTQEKVRDALQSLQRPITFDEPFTR